MNRARKLRQSWLTGRRGLGEAWANLGCADVSTEVDDVYNLDSVLGTANLPFEGIWIHDKERHVLFIGYYFLQALKLPGAEESLIECGRKFRRGPGQEFKRVIHIARMHFPAKQAVNVKEWKSIMASVKQKVEAEVRLRFNDADYRAKVWDAFFPWTRKYALESIPMVDSLHWMWGLEIGHYECHTRSYQQRWRLSQRAYEKACKSLKQEDGKLNQRLVDYIACLIGGDCGMYWRILMSRDWDTAKRVAAGQAATMGNRSGQKKRCEARDALRQMKYSPIKERRLAMGAYLVVQQELLQQPVDILIRAAKAGEVVLPYPELEKLKPQHISTYLMKPVYDALGVERRPGRPLGRGTSEVDRVLDSAPDLVLPSTEYDDDLDIILGGRAAEEAKYGPKPNRVQRSN